MYLYGPTANILHIIIDVYIIIVLKHPPWHIIGKFIVIASDNKYAKHI